MPLTDADQTAMATALMNPVGNSASKTAALKLIYQVAANAKTLGVSDSEICGALSDGFEGTGETALFEALSWELKILGSWGALVIQAAGILAIIHWLKNATSWFFNIISSLSQLFLGMSGGIVGTAIGGIGGAILSPLAGLANLFGIGKSGVKKDSNAIVSGLLVMASAEAPVLSAVINTLGMTAGSMGGGVGGGGFAGLGGGAGGGTATTPTGTGTGANLAMNTPTGTGTGTPTGATGTGGLAANTPTGTGGVATAPTGGSPAPTTPTDRRRRRDMRAVGIRSRRNLVNANTRM